MCSEHALSLIQSLVAKRQRSCVAQSVEQSPGLREVLGSSPGTADQCFSAILRSITSVFFFFIGSKWCNIDEKLGIKGPLEQRNWKKLRA